MTQGNEADGSPSGWDRFIWHPAVVGLPLVGIVLIIATRGITPINGTALVVCIGYFIYSVWSYVKQRNPGNAPKRPAVSEEEARAWYERKSAMMEQLLGKEHDMVMHAIIPYAVGGGLDLYYYPNGVPGVAIATKELSDSPDEGSSNAVFRRYELVMFTKHKLDLDAAKDDQHPFGRMHSTINRILNHLAPYSAHATLNPRETCEFPKEFDHVGGKCLIFDAYRRANPDNGMDDFGLLAVIEIFRSEMDFARENGGNELLARLKARGHYPYSDLDREPVA